MRSEVTDKDNICSDIRSYRRLREGEVNRNLGQYRLEKLERSVAIQFGPPMIMARWGRSNLVPCLFRPERDYDRPLSESTRGVMLGTGLDLLATRVRETEGS